MPRPLPTTRFATGLQSVLYGGSIVTIRTMSVLEAELAKAKLASEGVRSFISDENLAVMHPLMMGSVHLQVDEADIDRAEQILTLPAPADAEGEYVEEKYRCPRCHT